MADLTLMRESPLAHLAERMRHGSGPGVILVEVPFRTMVSLRVDPASAAATRIADYLGTPVPAGVGATSTPGPTTALWLGPDEWLLVSDADTTAGADLVDRLTAALGEERGAVVDVSANRTVLALSGPGARDVLEKGCPVDLHPRAFGPGKAVTTTLGQVPLLLWQTDSDGEGDHAPKYLLLPRASFADYTARWLLDAMRELNENS